MKGIGRNCAQGVENFSVTYLGLGREKNQTDFFQNRVCP